MKLWAVEMDYQARDPLDLDYHGKRFFVLSEDKAGAEEKVRQYRAAHPEGPRDAKAIRYVEIKSYIP